MLNMEKTGYPVETAILRNCVILLTAHMSCIRQMFFMATDTVQLSRAYLFIISVLR